MTIYCNSRLFWCGSVQSFCDFAWSSIRIGKACMHMHVTVLPCFSFRRMMSPTSPALPSLLDTTFSRSCSTYPERQLNRWFFLFLSVGQYKIQVRFEAHVACSQWTYWVAFIIYPVCFQALSRARGKLSSVWCGDVINHDLSEWLHGRASRKLIMNVN